MKFYNPTDKAITDAHRKLFHQGANLIVSQDDFSAALWFKNTPVYENKNIGTIGGLEIDDSPEASDFISSCVNHLHQKYNCTTVVGPMNGNTWQEHRLVLESNGRDPFFMEPIECMHFHDTFLAAGFSLFSQYSSSSVDLTLNQKNYTSLENRLIKSGICIRKINMENFVHDLNAIYDLSLASFSDNFLYTSISRNSFLMKYLSSRDHIDPDFILMAERKGQLVGYVFCIPDLIAQQLDKKPSVIIKTLAALPEHSLSGIGTLLVTKAQKIAKKKGYTEALHALQYENNSSRRISKRFNARVFRRYGLMAKSFSHTL